MENEEVDIDKRWLTLTVDFDMRFETRCLFSEGAYSILVEEWNRFLGKVDTTWITSSFSRPTIAEFLMFSFDPRHRQDLSQLLRGNALCLLTQIALLLDDKVQEIGAQVEDFEVSRYKRRPSSILLEQKRLIAERLWNSKETLLA